MNSALRDLLSAENPPSQEAVVEAVRVFAEAAGDRAELQRSGIPLHELLLDILSNAPPGAPFTISRALRILLREVSGQLTVYDPEYVTNLIDMSAAVDAPRFSAEYKQIATEAGKTRRDEVYGSALGVIVEYRIGSVYWWRHEARTTSNPDVAFRLFAQAYGWAAVLTAVELATATTPLPHSVLAATIEIAEAVFGYRVSDLAPLLELVANRPSMPSLDVPGSAAAQRLREVLLEMSLQKLVRTRAHLFAAPEAGSEPPTSGSS